MKPVGLRLLVCGLLALLAMGCGQRTIPVADPTDMAELNEDTRGEKVTLTLVDDTHVSAKDIFVTSELTSWMDVKEGMRDSVSTAKVRSIKVGKAGRGAGYGFLGGAALGTVFASASYFSNPDDPYGELAFLFFPPLFALIGTVVGAVSSRDLYDFAPLLPEQPASDSGAEEQPTRRHEFIRSKR